MKSGLTLLKATYSTCIIPTNVLNRVSQYQFLEFDVIFILEVIDDLSFEKRLVRIGRIEVEVYFHLDDLPRIFSGAS